MIKIFSSIKRIIIELNYILLPSHKKHILPLFIVGVMSAIFELLGVTIILPFVQAVLEPEAVINNQYIRPILFFLGVNDSRTILILLGIAIILLYIAKNVFLMGATYYQSAYAARVQTELSVKMLKAYMQRPYVFYTNTSSAEISRGSEQDVIRVHSTLISIMDIVTQLLTFVAIASYILVSEPIIATGVIAMLLITLFIMIYVFKPAIKRLGKKNVTAMTNRGKVMYQVTQGIKELYVMDRKTLFLEKYSHEADNARKVSRNFQFVSTIPNRIVEAICVSGLIGIVIIRLLSEADMAAFVPKLAVFAMASFKLMPSVGAISSRINTLVFGMPQIDSVYANMVEANRFIKEQEEYNRFHSTDGTVEYDEDNSRHFTNELQIVNVLWKYDAAPNPVLTDVNLSIKKGEAIGLIGPSGAGKTTLVDLILGLYKPQNGSITMDGIDVFTMPHTWSRIVSYVQQSVFLTDDTVRANVAFGLENISDDKIWAALEKASLGDFVKSLPDGLDTLVGERGVKFSGGQRQRIAIARALYNEPEILVLDEATSALDNETEQAIMESIESLQGHVTLIIVAHRLTTIMNCDRIYKIENGVATEQEKSKIFGDV